MIRIYINELIEPFSYDYSYFYTWPATKRWLKLIYLSFFNIIIFQVVYPVGLVCFVELCLHDQISKNV